MPPLSAYLLLHVSTGTEILRTRGFGRTAKYVEQKQIIVQSIATERAE